MPVLNELVGMGFPEDVCKEAVKKDPTLEGAMEWVLAHLPDAAAATGDGAAKAEMPDEAAPSTSGEAAPEAPKVCKSFRCVDTGKVFRTMTDAKIYAEKTGNANFEECDIEIPPLTEEEKKRKVAELRALMKKKKAEREANEKTEAIEREKKRRAGGQNMGQVRDELEAMQRNREYEARKKEKDAFKAHKERLRREVAKDKAERAADKARREGRDPKVAYDEALAKALGKGSGAAAGAEKGGGAPVATTSPARMDAAITRLQSYRAGGDGERALKTLAKLLANVLKDTNEPKYRRINLANEAIKKRIASLVGGVEFLKACGFKKIEAEKVLLLEDEALSVETLKLAKSKLDAALAAT